jgi:cytochrome P450
MELHLAHEQYGDIVRDGPNHLSFRSLEGIYDIYDRKANVVKGGGMTEASEQINRPPNTHSITNRELHAKRRRLLANAFSENALRNLEPFIVDTVQKWINALASPQGSSSESKGWTEPKDMGVWSSNLTLDVLGELCFGNSFSAIEKGSSWVPELLMGSTKLAAMLAVIPIREFLYPLIRQHWLMQAIGAKGPKQRTAYRAYMLPLLKARFKLEEDTKNDPERQRKDFMHFIMQATDPETGDKFAPPDLVGEAALLVGAGTDTTSTALAALFFYLTRSPTVLHKLQQEVRTAFPDLQSIHAGPELTNLKYLRACCDEALRLGSPVPDHLSRRVLPGGINIAGHEIPEGTIVGNSQYTIHHHESYFPRSFDFLPERWIPGSHEQEKGLGFDVTAESLETAKRAFIPFSVGPRNCVGKNMAMMEMTLAVARVVWALEFRRPEGDAGRVGEGGQTGEKGRERKGEFQTVCWFLADRDGPMVEFRRRELGAEA